MDAQAKEVTDKIQVLVKSKFNGDYLAAFKSYDLDHNGKLGPKDLSGLLQDAGIGNWITRRAWVSGIIAQLDKDRDGAVSLAELAVAIAEDAAFSPPT